MWISVSASALVGNQQESSQLHSELGIDTISIYSSQLSNLCFLSLASVTIVKYLQLGSNQSFSERTMSPFPHRWLLSRTFIFSSTIFCFHSIAFTAFNLLQTDAIRNIFNTVVWMLARLCIYIWLHINCVKYSVYRYLDNNWLIMRKLNYRA